MTTLSPNWLFLRLAEAQIALMTLTRVPAGRVADPVPTIAAASWAFPIIGLIVGGFSALGFVLALGVNLPVALAALIAIAVGLIVTGALHEDGLADVSDGFGGGQTTERKLAIMRDSQVGSYGVLALILAIAVRAVCMTEIDNSTIIICALVALSAASRAAIVLVLFVLPPARADGLGQSATSVELVRCIVALVCGLGALIVMTNAWLLVIVAMAVAGMLVAWIAVRQIGGQTGDVLGAVQQVTELAGWIAIVSWSVQL